MEPSDAAIAVQNLSKRFLGRGGIPALAALRIGYSKASPAGRQQSGARRWFSALEGLSFQVRKGETVALVGPNGSGKTTLMKILAGVMEPDAGEVRVAGRVGALLELGAGFHPDLTGRENVFLNAAVLGMGRSETERLLPEIVRFSELEEFIDLPVKHYSSGMTVRLGFAVAAQLRCDVLLLDETFSVGDARFQKRALERIRQFKREGLTQVLVSHDLEMLGELADRAIWIDGGQIIRDGEAGEVLRAYGASGSLSADRPAERRSAEPASPAIGLQLVSGDIGSYRGGEGSEESEEGLRGDQTVECESTSALLLRVRLKVHREASPLRIRVQFERDDGIIAAESRHAPESKNRSGEMELLLHFNPVRLAAGEYQVKLQVEEAAFRDVVQTAPGTAAFPGGGKDRRMGQSLVLARRLRVRTPPPFPGFRKVADLPAFWQ